MGTMPPEELSENKNAFQQLAEHLLTETSAETILQHLEELREALADQLGTQEGQPLAFLQAKGLPTLLRLLKGPARSHAKTDAGSTILTISESAGKALISLLKCTAEYHKPFFTELTQAMMSALRDAPHTTARVAAASALAMAAQSGPEARKAIAEAGVIGLVLAFFRKVGESIWGEREEVGPVWDLAYVLLRSEKAAQRELKDAIGDADADIAFIALIAVFILGGTLGETGADLMPAMEKGGLTKALVSALKHKSPCCAGAAAGVLSMIRQYPGGYQLLEASDAVPALVTAIKTAPAADLKKMSRFCSGGASAFSLPGTCGGTQRIPFSNPTAVMVAVLWTLKLNGRLLGSFLTSGGITTVVRLLLKSTCPTVIDHSAYLLGRMLDPRTYLPEKPTRAPKDLAEKFFHAGMCKAAVQAVKKPIKGTERSFLYMLVMFFVALPDHFYREAMKPLVAGGLVEFTMAQMAKAGADELECALALFEACLILPEGAQRMCAPKMVDQLMKWTARWLMEAENPGAAFLSQLLEFDAACCVPAAINGNVIPGLVRCLNKTLEFVESDTEGVGLGVEAVLGCFKKLMEHDKLDTCQWLEPAVDAGLVPTLIDLLKLDNEMAIIQTLELSRRVMMSAPKGQDFQWGAGLVRAIVQLLTARAGANPPVAAYTAATTLCEISVSFPALTAVIRTPDVEESLERLTKHRDQDMVAAARELQELLFGVKETAHEAHQSSCASNPSSNTAEDRPPGILDPNQEVLPVAIPSPTAVGTPEPVKGPDGGDKDKPAAVEETGGGDKNCGDKDMPANLEGTDDTRFLALKLASEGIGLWWPEERQRRPP